MGSDKREIETGRKRERDTKRTTEKAVKIEKER